MIEPERAIDPAECLERAWASGLDDDVARAHSAYYGHHDGELVRLLETAPPSTFARVAHAAFRSFILDEAYPCLGARAALHRNTYRFGAYDRLDDPAVTRGMMRDLAAFAAERRGIGTTFTTFVAVFRGAVPGGEAGFERALWSQLQRLHELDAPLNDWDPHVSDDPDDPHFSYSVAGTAFFVVGLHPEASRSARRFAWPSLVFNAHEQFETLKSEGRFAGLQRQIRRRDIELQGSINGNLADYGRHSEARQYAGRLTEDGWKCPFHRSR